MTERIPVAMVLKPAHCTPAGCARVQELGSRLGLEPTSGGRATVSFRVDAEQFQQVFGRKPKAVQRQPPGEGDFGRPAGWEEEQPLPVPEELSEYVESVGVVPPAVRFG